MGLIRLLLLIAVAWIVMHLWRAWRRRQRVPVRRQVRVGGPMKRCALCGLHVPAPEALVCGEAAYCCAAHRDAHRAGEGGA